MKKVLIVESDPGMQHFLRRILSKHYEVLVGEANKAIGEMLVEKQPDLVILDDTERCKEVREHWPNILIMMLSTVENEEHAVRALDLGCDGYMIKPFSSEEFGARIRALLRRMPNSGRLLAVQEPEFLQSDDKYIWLNKMQHLAYAGEQQVFFTPTEFALIWQLLLHAGKVLSHRILLKEVWGPEYESEADYLRVYVRQIRRKIEVEPSVPRYIITEPGVGYVFRSPSQ